MYNSVTIKTFAFFAGVLFSIHLQAQTLTDPGISSHNYKMPNKAKMAGLSSHQIVLAKQSFKTDSKSAHQTPKYAAAPATVISVKTQQSTNVINPLHSVANYKAQAVYRPEETTQAMMTCSL